MNKHLIPMAIAAAIISTSTAAFAEGQHAIGATLGTGNDTTQTEVRNGHVADAYDLRAFTVSYNYMFNSKHGIAASLANTTLYGDTNRVSTFVYHRYTSTGKNITPYIQTGIAHTSKIAFALEVGADMEINDDVSARFAYEFTLASGDAKTHYTRQISIGAFYHF